MNVLHINLMHAELSGVIINYNSRYVNILYLQNNVIYLVKRSTFKCIILRYFLSVYQPTSDSSVYMFLGLIFRDEHGTRIARRTAFCLYL